MDSLVALCAHPVITRPSLPPLPPGVYSDLFKAAFLDRRPLVLQGLVAVWPFKKLNLQELVGQRPLPQDHTRIDCIKAIIQGVVAQLKQKLKDPSCKSRLCVLDMTGLVAGLTRFHSTEALAKACVEVSKHQQPLQTASTAPQTSAVGVHTDLTVSIISYEILCNVLQTGATSPLRLKCREFRVEQLKASKIVTLLESLDPSCLRRVDLHCNTLGWPGLLVILQHLSRFPELRSLSFLEGDVYNPDRMPESASEIRCVARQLGMLPSLRELKLGYSRLSGNLRQILCDLQAPLESLELDSCFLVPADLAFLSQSFHAAALKKLNLSGHDISQGLLEPLRLLLEEASASLLYLELEFCSMDDSHLHALLPTLQRCSRLRFLRLCDNPLSMAALKDLLQKTLELPDLKLVVYPQPRDCFRLEPSEFGRDFREVVDEELLAAATAEISQLLENSGRTDLVWTDDPSGHEGLDYFSL